LDPSYRAFLDLSNLKLNANELAPSAVIYLGPSLMSASTAAGAHIPRAEAQYVLPGTTTVRAFDSTWNHPLNPAAAGYINPAAVWNNQYYWDPATESARTGKTATDHGYASTQSENPANYVGWRNVPIAITDSEAAPGNRDLLTTGAQLSKKQVDSKALVWQGHLWDNAIVGTYGYREDTAKSWSYSQDVNGRPGFGFADLSPDGFRLPTVTDGAITDQAPTGSSGYNSLKVTSRAYSIVGHLNQLPGLAGPMEKFPLNVSLFYNRSTNFQPLASRVDAYGDPISAPEGRTIDRGILFETKDGKYSFKINRYVTRVTNASSNALSQTWFIGSSQAWAGNWANHFEFNWTGDTIDTAVKVPQRPDYADDASYQAAVDNYNYNSQWNYGTAPGETRDQAITREHAAINAWRTWQASVDPRFYKAWGIDLGKPTAATNRGGIGASTPQGFTVTEDTTSKGYEFEFSALPTRNWRVTFNATRSVATRENIGGAALAEFINGYEDALKNKGAGDLRIWWGGSGNETTLFQWNQNVGFEWTSRKLQEGSNVPELRKWRFNGITNYDFSEGRLKGFNVGGGIRYQDSVIIGYHPVRIDPQTIGVDLTQPYEGPSETNFDFWVGYQRRFSDKVDWRIQLNVRNAFDNNSLIPITVQPDGTPAAYRIAPSRLWTIDNSFKF
jgi:hypothetical protein